MRIQQRKLPFGERAGFIEHNSIDIAALFNGDLALDEDTRLSSLSGSYGQGERGSHAQRTGTRNDEQRYHIAHGFVGRPHHPEGGGEDRQRGNACHKVAGEAIGEVSYACRLGGLFAYPGQ